MEAKTAEQFYADAIIERTQACFDQNEKVDIEPFMIRAMKGYAEQAVKADREKIENNIDDFTFIIKSMDGDLSVLCRGDFVNRPIELP